MKALESRSIVGRPTGFVTATGTVPLFDSQVGAKHELADFFGLGPSHDAALGGMRNLSGQFRFN